MRFLGHAFAVVITLLSTRALDAQSIVVRVVDQFGAEIPGSVVKNPATPWTATGGTVSLPVGTHEFTVHPGSSLGNSMSLWRSEMVTVTPTTTVLTFEWITSAVTLRLHNQLGNDIENSVVRFAGSSPIPNGSVVRVPVTDESIYPTIAGDHATGYRGVWGAGRTGSGGVTGLSGVYDLTRTVVLGEVGIGTTELSTEWVTANVTLRIVNQHGLVIDGSTIRFGGTFPLPTGTTLELPITDNAVYPELFGGYADGYDAVLIAGRTGYGVSAGQYDLFREVGQQEVDAATTELVFEWATALVTVRLQDQHGVEILGSKFRVGGGPRLDTGSQIVLPITDEAVYPTIFGRYADGFEVVVSPGVVWSHRPPTIDEQLARSMHREITAATTSIVVEWHVNECALAVRPVGGLEVPATLFFGSPHNTFAHGVVVRLPTTENSVYPDITGGAADGYRIAVAPAAVAPATGTFQFEMLRSGAFVPGTFSIAGQDYMLFCRLNTPPVVDAGPNRTLLSSEVTTASLIGTASDPEGQPMTYRWLEGGAPRIGPLPVVAGVAPLPLGAVAGWTLGEHELVLEVTDGDATTTARMTLTIGNSPPLATCSGNGVYQAGVDTVTLRGAVSDFDGDLLQWSWWNGSTLLASGNATPPSGGGVLQLPPVVLTTGAVSPLVVGVHSLQMRVTDGVATPVLCDANIIVIDDMAPRLAPVADRTQLWPPNHEMIPITITANAVDAGGGPVLLSATVQSSEDAYKDGSGHTIPDFSDVLVDPVGGRVHVFLRAERAGRGPGRTYTVTVTARDLAGNQSSAQVAVVAPRDRGN